MALKNTTGVSTKEANKVIPVYSLPESRPQCLVYLLDIYLKKLPPKAFEVDVLYLRPKKNYTDSCRLLVRLHTSGEGEAPNLSASNVSRCRNMTNHSLRATGASALFSAGMPEKLIRDVTGHRSSALQLYERPTVEQKQAVSRVLVQGHAVYISAAQYTFRALNTHSCSW